MAVEGGDRPGDHARRDQEGHRAVRCGELGDLDGLAALRAARAWCYEAYPQIGRLRSALHLPTRDAFERRLARRDAQRFAALVGAGGDDAGRPDAAASSFI